MKEWEGVIAKEPVKVCVDIGAHATSIIVKVMREGRWFTLSPHCVSERFFIARLLHTILEDGKPPTEVDHLAKAQEALNALAAERKQVRLDRSSARAPAGLLHRLQRRQRTGGAMKHCKVMLCADCRTSKRRVAWGNFCGWPCSMFGFRELLRDVQARGRRRRIRAEVRS